jgi:hypothetical protein
MPPPAYIHRRLSALPAEQQVQALLRALDLQKEHPRYQPVDCIGLALGIPLFPKVAEARWVGGYRLALRFETGEEGELDFREHLDAGRELERRLLEDEALFQQFELQEGTLVWPALGREMADVEGEVRFYAFDVDPGLLYEWVIC